MDNGSTDGSGDLAAAAGARVIDEPRRGYGNAYLAGLSAARGKLHRDARRRPHLRRGRAAEVRRRARGGGDLVLGDRMKGIQPGAMPWLHHHVGNPMLTGLLNRLFGTEVRDAHCGMRALRHDVLPRLDLRTTAWSSPPRW